MIRHPFFMTKDKFKEIIQRCCNEKVDFVKEAKWDLLESEEPNSVDVKVSIIKQIFVNAKKNQIIISGTSRTQDSPECIQSAIEALNEQLLSKL